MVAELEAARAAVEKNRMDPPPEGMEWCLGWTQDGQRDPMRDVLVALERAPGDPAGGLHGGDEMLPGYEYQSAGLGVRSDLVDAAMRALADLDVTYQINTGLRAPLDVEDAVARTLAVAGTEAGGYLREVRNVVRLAVRAALEQLRENP